MSDLDQIHTALERLFDEKGQFIDVWIDLIIPDMALFRFIMVDETVTSRANYGYL